MKSTRLTHPIISHPSIIFISVWGFAILLSSFRFVEAFSVYYAVSVVLVFFLILSNLLGASFAFILTGVNRYRFGSHICFLYERRIFNIWISISLFETIYFGGYPLFWLFTGSGKTYADFGFPTLHGLANAMWLFLAFSSLIGVVNGARKIRDISKLILLMSWPFLMVSRALFTIFIIQSIIYFVITSNFKFSRLVFSFCVFLVVFGIGFGIVGDLRSPDFSLAESLGSDVVDPFLIGLLWFYSYVVSPLANLSFNWQVSEPDYVIIPVNTLTVLLPSVVKNLIGVKTDFDGYLGEILHPAFNAGTAFLAPYYDFGISGIIISSFLIGAVGHSIWVKAQSPRYIPLLATFGGFTALTIFANFYISPATLFYMFLLSKFTVNINVHRADI